MMDYKLAAKNFLENEKQYHLGMIPTEQPNARTRHLSTIIAEDTAEGIRTILDADTDIPQVASRVFESESFRQLTGSITRNIREGRKIVFSGVGASGRLAVQFDATWRNFWFSLADKLPSRKDEFLGIGELGCSIITGGDRALVRSVENFEDYLVFGREQVREANLAKDDLVIGFSECGMSASINGSVLEADDRGCKVFYLYCNPRQVLCDNLERVKVVFERENIIPIELYVGQMAISGSTRMQTTTVELLVAGAAMEIGCWEWIKENLSVEERKTLGVGALKAQEYVAEYQKLLDTLKTGEALNGLRQMVEMEADTYGKGGLVTYATHEYLLDILTDTTERTPTFTLPPFRKHSNKTDLVSWAYAVDPLYSSKDAWEVLLNRPIRGLEWTREDYIRMGAAQSIIDNPPAVSASECSQYYIGNEDDESRYNVEPSVLVCMDINGSAHDGVLNWFNDYKARFSSSCMLRLGGIEKKGRSRDEILIPAVLPRTITDLMTHLLVKVSFNVFSTATMAKMGRVWDNWMIQVFPSNKKLIDRSTRIISTLANIPYSQACEEFFKSYYGRKEIDIYKESYVVETLKRLGFDPNAKPEAAGNNQGQEGKDSISGKSR